MLKPNAGAVMFAAACVLSGVSAAHARDVKIAGPIGALLVGQAATFTVSDQALEDQCDLILGYCASDFVVAYDRTVLEYIRTDYAGPVLLDPVFDLFSAPGVGDPDPAGLLNVQLVLTSALPSGPADIFSVTFRAVGVSSAGGSLVSVSPLSDAPSYEFQSATTSVSVVPEPSIIWMMSAGLIAGLIGRVRQK